LREGASEERGRRREREKEGGRAYPRLIALAVN